MNITNRTFTYPVLTMENSNYNTSKFTSEITCKVVDAINIKLTIKINLTDEFLKFLIRSGQADYVVHLECSISAYRVIKRSTDSYIECLIPASKVTDYIDVLVLVMSKKEITDFYSPDFNELFERRRFTIAKSSILAYENNDSIIIKKNYENFDKLESIFKVKKQVQIDKAVKDYPVEYYWDNDYILIFLGEEQYNIYKAMFQNPKYQSILNSMIVYPALVNAFTALQIQENYDEIKTKLWYMSLEKAYALLGTGKTIVEKLTYYNEEPYKVAQEIMYFPINKAFGALLVMGDGE